MQERWQQLAQSPLIVPSAAALVQLGTHCDAAAAVTVAALDELDTALQAAPGAGGVAAWLHQAGSFGQRLDRLAVLRWVELRMLQAPSAVSAAPGEVPAPAQGNKRPLRPVEAALVRWAVRSDADVAVPVAMLEAMATPTELGSRRTWIRPDLAYGGYLVDLPGTARTAPRTGRLPAWVARHLDGRMDELGMAALPLLYTGRAREETKISCAVHMRISKALRRCGMADDAFVDPASIRLTAAQQVRDRAGLPAAAAAMGARNLERVRGLLAWQ